MKTMNMQDKEDAVILDAVIDGTERVEIFWFDKSAKLRVEIVDGRIVALADMATGRIENVAGKKWKMALLSDPLGEWERRPTVTLNPAN